MGKEAVKTEKKSSRRDYGDGSLYFRKSDQRWVGSFYHNNERRYVYSSVGGKKEEARAKLKEAIKLAEAGQLVASNKQKMAEFLEYWLSVKKLPLKPGTFQTHSSYVRVHLIPLLGKIQLQRLARSHIQHLINTLASEEMKPSTIHTVYTILKSALADAVEWQLIGANPCKSIVLPRIEEHDYMVLDREQAQAFLASLSGHRLEALITLALATGMRRGELLALKWSDIDFERGRLRVQRTLIFINKQGYQETAPKTKGSRRTITLTRTATDALKVHRRQQIQARSPDSPGWKDMDLVFPNKTGGYMCFNTLTNWFRGALEAAGLPEMRFHDLRHTCATLLLSMSASPKVVSELLGHSTIQITMDLYSHVIPGIQEYVMQEYDILLKSHPVTAKGAN